MVRIRWTAEELRYMNVFETLTGAIVKDVLVEGDTMIFFVEEGHAGRAIGKRGEKVKQLERIFGKKVKVMEISKDPAKFAGEILKPARISAIFVSQRSDGKKVLNIVTKDKVSVRKKLKNLREWLDRYFGIKEIVVM